MKNNKLIILDRDGILNKLLLKDLNTSYYDSPQNLNEIEVFSWVPTCLKQLCELGFSLAIATNQPAAAKGKNSYDMLNQIHNYIMEQAKSQGAKILSSNICWHQAEDQCLCRKPKTGMLEHAFFCGDFVASQSWMVGDRATDIIAGSSFGIQTAWLGTPILGDDELLKNKNLNPTYRGQDLRDFMRHCIF